MSFLEAEYLPYHIKVLPLIFSHVGILFAYHTTSFLSHRNLSLNFCSSIIRINPTASGAYGDATHEDGHGAKNAYINGADTSANMSFQKSLVFYRFHTQTPLIEVYTFFNQK